MRLDKKEVDMNEKELKFILLDREGMKVEFKESFDAKSLPKTTPKTEDKILALVKENPNITKEELAKQLDITIDGIKYHTKSLKKRKIVIWKGSSKSGHWEIMI